MTTGESLVTLSIVSHGQGHLIASLLADLHSIRDIPFEVILTLNIPEDEKYLEAHSVLSLRVIRNTYKKGFGANHNAAFAISRGDPFVIVNPDIRLSNFSLKPLVELLSPPGVGASAPVVVSSDGQVQDSVRRYPTIRRLMCKIFRRKPMPDYQWGQAPIEVDWAAGMFVAYKRAAYGDVNGFNEAYFMYYEDADIGRRLAKQGWRTVLLPTSVVIHDAQRASRRSFRHLRWQIGSCARFLLTR